jgi:PAS domain S-box-containing protein
LVPIKAETVDGELVAARDALRDSDARFNTLADALPHMVWSTLPDGYHDYYNASWYEFTGVTLGSTDGEGWSDMFHPEDRERAWSRWRDSLATGEPYEIEYRLRHHSGEYRWTLGRAMPMRDPEGKIIRWIGTCTDIHKAKLHAEQNEILSRELSHRIKNIFAVIGGLIGLSARNQPERKPFAQQLQQRIAALARAHEFVRPHSDQSQPPTAPGSLHALLQEVLSPYPALADGHIQITGDDAVIDDSGATPIALLVHELATNASKYGALSIDAGEVHIRTAQEDGKVTISWRERSGPPLIGVPERRGFGTMLIDLSIVNQLGGTIERDWDPAGLDVVVAVTLKRLSRSGRT